jgi:MerR family transcriptional regulator, light-induced transcriptional regulator
MTELKGTSNAITQSEIDCNEFLESLLSGNHSTSYSLVQSYLSSGKSIQYIFENILKTSLYRIGELWEYNKISVATEHMASAIVESLLNQLYNHIATGEKINKTVITTCVENEYHQIGIKMISDVFEIYGWNTFFLGSNTPTLEINSFINEIKPDIFAISLSLYFNLPYLEELIQNVQKEHPDLTLLVGGHAFTQGGTEVISKYKNVIYKSDLKSLEEFIHNFS